MWDNYNNVPFRALSKNEKSYLFTFVSNADRSWIKFRFVGRIVQAVLKKWSLFAGSYCIPCALSGVFAEGSGLFAPKS